MMILQTPRLTLRPFEDADANLIAHYCNDPEVSRNTATIPHPYPLEKALSFLEYTRKHEFGENGAVWAIVWRETETLCGCIELNANPKDECAELGYWIGRDYWGRGIATEASQEVIRCGFETLNLHKITSGYYEFNAASERVQEKLGFTIEGRLREQVKRDGVYHALIKTGLLRSEWKPT